MPTAKNTTNDGIPNLSETLLETIQAISRIEKNSKKEYDSLPTKTLFEKNLNKLSLINEKHFSFVKERYPDFFNSDSESLQQMKTFLNKLYETSKLIENCIEGDLSKILPLKDKDKRRSLFYNYFTDMKWGNPHNYDICLNSGILGFEKCVDIISSLY